MTELAKLDQNQLMTALAEILGQNVQEIEGTIVTASRADEILEEAEEHYADVLREHGLGYTDTYFDEVVQRLERLRALRNGEDASRYAQRRKRR